MSAREPAKTDVLVTRICRYPVKGMSPEPQERADLKVGQCLPQDRRFALARPETQFDPKQPEWLAKTHFVMLIREAQLAQLQTRFDEHSGILAIRRNGSLLLEKNILGEDGRRAVEQFFDDFLKGALSGPPRLVEAPGHTFSNAQQKPNSTTFKYVSLINMATIRSLEQATQAEIDPMRFRGNVYFDGAPPWAEFDWVGSDLVLGGARVRVVSRTVRCAATIVNPATAERDLNVPALLQKSFRHCDLGVYAEVVSDGEVAVGAPVVRPVN